MMDILESLEILEQKVEGMMVGYVKLLQENQELKAKNQELEEKSQGFLNQIETFEKVKLGVRKKIEGLIEQLMEMEYDDEVKKPDKDFIKTLNPEVPSIQETSIQFLPEEDSI